MDIDNYSRLVTLAAGTLDKRAMAMYIKGSSKPGLSLSRRGLFPGSLSKHREALELAKQLAPEAEKFQLAKEREAQSVANALKRYGKQVTFGTLDDRFYLRGGMRTKMPKALKEGIDRLSSLGYDATVKSPALRERYPDKFKHVSAFNIDATALRPKFRVTEDYVDHWSLAQPFHWYGNDKYKRVK